VRQVPAGSPALLPAPAGARGYRTQGGFAEYLVAPAGKCYPVDDLDLDTAVLAEPVACAIHGLDVLAMRPGSDVLVLGAGPSGLILTQLLRQSGPGVSPLPPRPRQSSSWLATSGADGTVRLDETIPKSAGRSCPRMAPEGFDIVIDATGALSALTRALGMVRDGGSFSSMAWRTKPPVSRSARTTCSGVS